ncbi:MAG TPA: capsule assembly Wzi family protein [Longimicrobium sp.]|jgi:hypothetical protein|uniref:capsule assembly Wzi family protein n=1 Tax=Longimicrobium sp. TaxID=2029185 RepID=UPI002EDBAEF6
MTRTARRCAASAALLSALLAERAAAQQTPPAGVPADSAAVAAVPARARMADAGGAAERFDASPSLTQDHWAVRAANRAEALGLAPGWLPAQRNVPRAAVAAALRQAVGRAPEHVPAMAGVAAGWLARFQEEFAEHRDGAAAAGLRPLGGYLGAGVHDLAGRLEPGAGLFHLRTDPVPIPDTRGLFAVGGAGVAAGRHLVAFVEPRAMDGALELPRWEVAAGAGGVALSAGRQPLGYARGESGGVVLGGGASLVRVQLESVRPLRLSGAFRYLGDVAFQTFGTRLDEARHRGDPWMWGGRLALRPHPRLAVAINRASIFGGDSIPTPTTMKVVARMLVGMLSADFENQVVSLDVRYRLPTERVLPLTLYLEWGADDASGSLRDVPAIVAGAYAPVLPGVPEVGAGVEYTHFEVFCCGNPPWYFNAAHPGGWVAEGALLGHPLGGDGHELHGYAHADLAQGRLRVDTRAFVRHREDKGYHRLEQAGNLMGPARFGGSRGGAVQAAWRAHPRVELRASAAGEAGGGWSERQLRTSLAWLF